MYYRPEINLKPEEVLDYLRKSQSDDPLMTVEEVLERHESILDDLSMQYLGGIVPEQNKFREVVYYGQRIISRKCCSCDAECQYENTEDHKDISGSFCHFHKHFPFYFLFLLIYIAN